MYFLYSACLACRPSVLLYLQVTNHHEALLVQAAGASELEGSLATVRRGLTEVTQSLDKCVISHTSVILLNSILLSYRLRQKIRVPYQTLEGHVSRLQRLQLASDVLRRTARFVIVARRLEFQMAEMNKAIGSTSGEGGEKTKISGKQLNNTVDDGYEGEKERNLAKAALSIAELGRHIPFIHSLEILTIMAASLLDDSMPRPNSPTNSSHESERSISDDSTIPLRSVNAVTAYLPAIDKARAQVTTEMENMVVSGLATMVYFWLVDSFTCILSLIRIESVFVGVFSSDCF